ncbi:MAG: WecB/TagA/CpsF family glycosyltransferase [Acidaminococcaceae bacterium]|jgi:N-acetylglucosaminyldiphosphoundecaprenol N-acetyl-beta-D-mannosaminyltransferase|nr:WecB/TagA/CpsF family glycosyltransferase [Acidaminococcaceae bacterium]HAY61865.1 glycosyltransferase [Acidaminococcaceae bacterium]HCJ91568.1 glycosyltransferase [Acidaminococcaceae bacterium]
MDESVALLTKNTLAGKRTFVVTANAEIIMMAHEDPAYRELLLQRADLVLPDGAGTVWAGNYLGYRVPERVAGYDLYLRLLEEAAQHGIPVYFFGGKPGIADEAAAEAVRRWPGLKVAGCRNGYFKPEEEAAIVEGINNSGAGMLFAALGAPKQENWLDHYASSLEPALLMGIGGSFDVLAGKVQRAPRWMQEARLEWLYRLLKQPSRLGRMMALPKFVLAVRSEKKEKD